MKIVYIEPIGVDIYSAHTRAVLEKGAAPGTTVEVRNLRLPPELTGPMLPVVPLYINELLTEIIAAEQEGADAVIIGCCSDPGLMEAQRTVKIPVVGPLQAATALAASRGKNLGVLCPDEHAWHVTANWIRRNLRAYGMADAVGAVEFVPMHVEGEATLVGPQTAELEEVLRRFRRQLRTAGVAAAQAMIEREPVDAVLFACTIWGGMIGEAAPKIDALCLDPVLTSLHIAEAQVRAASL